MIELFAKIGGEMYSLKKVGCPCACTLPTLKNTCNELDDTTNLASLGLCSPDCNLMKGIFREVDDWFVKSAASAEKACREKEVPVRTLEWCKPGMRIQVCPSDAAYYFAEVIEGPNDLTGSILVKNELTGRKHPVLATANVYAAPDPDDKAYGVNLRKGQSQAESSAAQLEST